MSSPADDPLHTVVKAASPVPEPTADAAPAAGTIVRGAPTPPADPNCTTVHPAAGPPAAPSVVENVNVTQMDGTHPVQSVPLPASDSVPGYEILSELGRGGMGVVYRADDPRLKRQVALKVLLPQVAGDPQAAARFRREAQAQAKVTHDNVIIVYSVEELNGVTLLTMPLLRGQTLAEALKQNARPPLAEVLRVAREMAKGWSNNWARSN